jgi:cytidine deaminase
MDTATQKALIDAATAAHARAYAPYSHFAVGAAVLDSAGRVFSGCNVENVSYGLTSCAERNAIFRAVVEGARRIQAVAVVTAAETLTPPCGACRQVLFEFALDGEMEVILAGTNGTLRRTRLSALLPESFASFAPTEG